MTITATANKRHDIRRSERFRPARIPHQGAAAFDADVTQLVGRHGELSWLDVHARRGRIAAVCGIGGIGKTALVEHWVRRKKDLAPDLYIATILASPGAAAELHAAIDRLRDADEALLWIEDAHALAQAEAAAVIVASHTLPNLTVIMTSRHTFVPATDILQLTHLSPAAAAHVFATALPLDALASVNAYVDAGVDALCSGWPLMLRVAAAAARALPPRDLAEAIATNACQLSHSDGIVDALAFGAGRLSPADRTLISTLAHLDEDVTRDIAAKLGRLSAPTGRPDVDGQLVRLVRDGWLIPLIGPGAEFAPRYRLLPAGRAWLRRLASTTPGEAGPDGGETVRTVADVARAAVRRYQRAVQAARLKNMLKSAAELLDGGELAQARIAIQRVVVEASRRPEAFKRIGLRAGALEVRLFLDEGLPDLAEAALDAMVAATSMTADVEGLRGLVALHQGRTADAISALTRATERAPTSTEWQLWRALAALAMNDMITIESAVKALVAIADGTRCGRTRRRIWSLVAALWAATRRTGVALALAEAETARTSDADTPATAMFVRFASVATDEDPHDNARCRRLQDARERLLKLPAPTFMARFFQDWAAKHLASRIETAVAQHRLVVVSDGTWFRGADGVDVELGRKPVLRLLLLVLARRRKPDATSPCSSLPIDQDTLIGEVWPGERIIPRAARSRLHVAICALRKAGLHDAIARRGTGYALDAEVTWVDVG
jgi:hypothetical protein